MKKYWETILDIAEDKEWFSNIDFQKRQRMSPKFTSRVSDMKKKGVMFEDRWVDNLEEGRHKEYRLETDREQVVKIMARRRQA